MDAAKGFFAENPQVKNIWFSVFIGAMTNPLVVT